jgi:hypothetical protein
MMISTLFGAHEPSLPSSRTRTMTEMFFALLCSGSYVSMANAKGFMGKLDDAKRRWSQTKGKSEPRRGASNGTVKRKHNRRHITFTNAQKPPFPVPIPRKEDKNDFWFRQAQQFVTVPRQIIVPAGKSVKFMVASELKLISITVTGSNSSVGKLDAAARTTLELMTTGASAAMASAQLLAQYGTDGAVSSKAAHAALKEAAAAPTQLEWVALATASTGTTQRSKHKLLPGVHALRANGPSDLLVMTYSAGFQIKLV